MANIIVDQKSVKDLFSAKKADFLIPDYQRPYAWTKTECLTLWDDLFEFSFPDDDCDAFDTNDEYFLGPIVTFKNEEGKQEIIDGQQRLTTLTLLLRAFYEKYGNMHSDKAHKTAVFIEQCLWKTDEFGDPDKEQLKILSEVATDADRDEFMSILKCGNAEGMNSRYAVNYRVFQERIQEFQNHYPDYFSNFPIRILQNCILLPIEAESQDTALRIFSTLNDRGLPLSDADIFKAQFYKYYKGNGKKDEFIEKWKNLEVLCNDLFPSSGSPMDELFTRYMYFERAKKGMKGSTTEALRKFYERDGYAILKNPETMPNLIELANFWKDVLNQNDRFSEKILRRLFVLQYAPNGMWTYFLSVYFMANKDDECNLDEDKLYEFLNRIIGFIWAYAVWNPGVNALRTPVYAEMLNIVNHKDVTFGDYKLDRNSVETSFKNYAFTNQRAMTRSMLAWWAFTDDSQPFLSLETVLEIEHIYAKNRYENEGNLGDAKNVESLGNKALLEKRINIRASDYRYADKTKYYLGYTNPKGQVKEGTNIKELRDMATNLADFTEQEIIHRQDAIIDGFMAYLDAEGLLK